MPQSTRRWISHKVDELRDAPQLPFHDLLDSAAVDRVLKEHRVRFRDRIFTPLVTLRTFLSQVLSPDHSCREAVARVIAFRVARGQKPCGPETGSYCKARKRLPLIKGYRASSVEISWHFLFRRAGIDGEGTRPVRPGRGRGSACESG